MFILPPNISKEYILSHVSQEEIFERYMGFSVKIGEAFCSPLRLDKNPTCTLKYIRNVLYLKDWSGHFSGDCFNLVQSMYNCGFYESLKIIAQDFNLINSPNVSQKKQKTKLPKTDMTKKTVIEVKWREFEKKDIAYWKSYGINLGILNFFKVAPVQFVWVNKELIYSYKDCDPAYAYYFSDKEIKVYFPERDYYRFLGNTNCLQGYNNLPKKGKLLIVTKSYKDVMFYKILGIPAVAPQSESSILTEKQYKDLSQRFEKIYSNYDFDLSGVRSANKMRKLYNIEPKFFTNGRFGTVDYKGKDVTDIYKRTKNSNAIYSLLCSEK